MSRITLASSLFALAASTLGIACTITPTDGSALGKSVPQGAAEVEAQDGGSSQRDASSTRTTLSFKPSNISIAGLDLSKVGDFIVDSATCTLHGEQKEVGCGDGDTLAFTVITQPDASKIGVYVARSIRVEPNAHLSFRGTFPIAIVALDTFDVLGAIDAGADHASATAGGFRPPMDAETKGGGPGGGGGGTATNGGAGASYCGQGGNGAAGQDGVVGEPGPTYGNAEIVPLIGGSAGGTAGLGNAAGTGGGALQLVAGTKFRLSASGAISAGGGGGSFWGGAATQHASGGGSGGSILVESLEAEIAGVIAANGGGGGAHDDGKNGAAGIDVALGGVDATGSKGGHGSAADTIKGEDGIWASPSNAPGGGGGAGRIRINTKSGAASISGVLSPAQASSCATQGTLK